MISEQEFRECFEIIVSRYGKYPVESPTSMCVGFTVTCKPNQHTRYVDTTILFSELPQEYNQEDVIDAAWLKLKDNILTWAGECCEIPCVLHKAVVPRSLAVSSSNV